MRTRRSSFVPTNDAEQPTSLRRSPRLQSRNNNSTAVDPKTPKPKSQNDTKLNNGSVKKASSRISSKGVNLGSGLRRSPRLNMWVGISDEKACENGDKEGCGGKSVKAEGCFAKKCDGKGEKKVGGISLGESGARAESACDRGIGEGSVRKVRGEAEDIDAKKKRKVKNEVSDEVSQGWSKEQELALEKAYFVAKPTPHFWKKVARMVPGKTAQECFDKVNSKYATPVPRPPRSRAKNVSPLGFKLSASKLLAPNEAKSRKAGCSKNKSQLAHKTVRELLQKQCHVKDKEADLFSTLEPDVVLSTNTSESSPHISTPSSVQATPVAFGKNSKTVSAFQRIPFSVVNSLTGTPLVSPPVLKQVKNPALHEKYIDLLHKRDAKRKAVAQRAKPMGGKENERGFNVLRTDVVRAAKDALFSGARDAISQLKSLQDNEMGTSSDFDDDLCMNDDDDEEED